MSSSRSRSSELPTEAKGLLSEVLLSEVVMKQQSINSSPKWNATRISSSLGIEYPIIQGPLGGLSTQRLTATVSNFGGLGSFGAHGLNPAAIKDVIAEIRVLTSKPFAVNLWVSMEDD